MTDGVIGLIISKDEGDAGAPFMFHLCLDGQVIVQELSLEQSDGLSAISCQ